MKFKCDKCGEEFDAQMYVKCPKCGEIKDVHPVSQYHREYREAPVHGE